MGGRNLMTMTITITLSLLLISSSSSSIYDALKSHGLPIGLLPKGIQNFTINPSTGQFQVHLHQSCDTKFETHVRYDFNISGTLSYAQIDQLSGVDAQDLFLWFPVKGIRVDIPTSGIIYFDVGVVFKQFSLSSFETPRDCTLTHSSSSSPSTQNQPPKLANKLDWGNARRAVS